MSTPIATVAALGSLLLATPALADRAGDAPIKAPRNLKTDHVAFTLPGGPWKQIVGALAGTPAFGRYALDAKLASGSVCNLTADAIGRSSARRPVVKGRTVRLRPRSPNSDLLRFTSQGRRGAVRWWAGTTKSALSGGSVAAAGGVQRLPKRLATKRHPYLVYSVTIEHSAPPADERECAAVARKTGARVARKVARTMHIADGPLVAKPPVTSA